MTGNGPRRIGELLGSGAISRLKDEAEERRNLTARVRAALPEQDAGHVVSAHIDDEGRLIVGMDSAAWAARLRYEKETLLGRQLKVRVAAPG